MTDFSFLFDLEMQLHSFDTRSSEQKISLLLSPDFFEFGSSGKTWTRHEILERLPTETQESTIQSSDYKATQLAEHIVLVTYVSQRIKNVSSSTEFLRSSIWRKNETGWQMEFHQGTPKS